MKLLVTGSRDYDDPNCVYAALKAVQRNAGGELIEVLHEGRGGAEAIAGAVARKNQHFGLVDVLLAELTFVGVNECHAFFQEGQDDEHAHAILEAARALSATTAAYYDTPSD